MNAHGQWLLGGTAVLVALVLVGVPALGSSRLSGPALRRLAHVMTGLIVAAAASMVTRTEALLAAGLATVVLVPVVELGLLGPMMSGSRRRDYGFVAWGPAAAICAFFLPEHTLEVSTAFVIVALADPAASAVGSRLRTRPIVAWQSRRTLGGTLTFATCASIIATTASVAHEGLHARALCVGLFVGITTAAIEAVAPSALDNLLVAVWAAASLVLALRMGDAESVRLIAALATATVLVVATVRLDWLDEAGAIAAGLVTTIAAGFGGWQWILPVGVFLVSTSLLSKLPGGGVRPHEARGVPAVVINGLLPVLPLIGSLFHPGALWFLMYIGATAVASADTWATEVGRRWGGPHLHLARLKRVPAGTPGAVSAGGTLASLAGGLLIVLAGLPFRPHDIPAGVLLLLGTVTGFLGAMVDTVLGTWLQARYRCAACSSLVDEKWHCGRQGHQVAGAKIIDNHAVNLLANVSGMACALTGLLVL